MTPYLILEPIVLSLNKLLPRCLMCHCHYVTWNTHAYCHHWPLEFVFVITECSRIRFVYHNPYTLKIGTVFWEGKSSEFFPIKQRVAQGCTSLPTLFLVGLY